MAKRLDRTQCHMVSLLLNYKRDDSVTTDMFYKNRSIAAGRTCTSLGRWSVLWARSVIKWNSHCLRAHDTDMWHRSILRFHDGLWLEKQRLLHGTGKKKKTCTRLSSGIVATRWSECIDKAVEFAPDWNVAVDEHPLYVRTILAAGLSSD